MTAQARWQQELTAALSLENAFIAAHPGFPGAALAESMKPTRAESERAVENIQSWRSYLPPACVASMVEEGWQWST